MASFMSSFFPGGKQQEKSDARPTTPTQVSSYANNFTTPVSTPQGSPSKRTVPPGANELPVALESMKLAATNALESPVKLGRPHGVGTPLSPGKSNLQNIDEGPLSVDNSIIHKGLTAPGTPQRSQGQENTPPVHIRDAPAEPAPVYQPSHAAVSRQELYQTRERLSPAVKRFNTQRGLTAEELEILQKPNIKRLVNVTQLCEPFSFSYRAGH